MKKLSRFTIMVCSTVLLTACSGQTSGTTNHIPETGGKTLVAYFTHEGNTVFAGDLSDVDAITSATVQRNGNSFPPQVVSTVEKPVGQ